MVKVVSMAALQSSCGWCLLPCLCHFHFRKSNPWWSETWKVCSQCFPVLEENRSVDRSCKAGIPSYINDKNDRVYCSVPRALCSYQHAHGGCSKKKLEDNQRVIESLFKVILLCGMQGLALRGHRDNHIEWDEEREESGNQGNFIALIQFRAETDETLKKHLQNAPRNATYTSKTIQNQLIDIIGKCIQMEILNEVKEAKFYSIIADEVCDVSNKEQLSLCVRYVQASSVKERFLDFVEVERITGRELASAILYCLRTWGLQLCYLRGQCYDGASNMADQVAQRLCSKKLQWHSTHTVLLTSLT